MEFYLSFADLFDKLPHKMATVFLPVFVVTILVEALVIQARHGSYPWHRRGGLRGPPDDHPGLLGELAEPDRCLPADRSRFLCRAIASGCSGPRTASITAANAWSLRPHFGSPDRSCPGCSCSICRLS